MDAGDDEGVTAYLWLIVSEVTGCKEKLSPGVDRYRISIILFMAVDINSWLYALIG